MYLINVYSLTHMLCANPNKETEENEKRQKKLRTIDEHQINFVCVDVYNRQKSP